MTSFNPEQPESRSAPKAPRLFSVAGLRWLKFFTINNQKFIPTFIFLMILSNIISLSYSFFGGVVRAIWGTRFFTESVIVVSATCIVVGMAMAILPAPRGPSEMRFKPAPHPALLVAVTFFGAAASVAFSIVAFMAVRTLFGAQAASVNFQVGLPAVPDAYQIGLLVVTAGIVVPLAEELLFRRWLFRRMVAAGFARFFLPVSVLTFGFVHIGQSPVKFVTIMMLGALCALLYVRTRHIFWPWLAHASNNVLAIGLIAAGL